MAAVVQQNCSRTQALGHAAVMIQGMDEAADFQDRLAERFSLFAREQVCQLFLLLGYQPACLKKNGAALRGRHFRPLF